MTITDERITALIESRLMAWMGRDARNLHSMAEWLQRDIRALLDSELEERRRALRARQLREREGA